MFLRYYRLIIYQHNTTINITRFKNINYPTFYSFNILMFYYVHFFPFTIGNETVRILNYFIINKMSKPNAAERHFI